MTSIEVKPILANLFFQYRLIIKMQININININNIKYVIIISSLKF
jgi:hypothetical protein